jgi:hypothetical protein
VHAAVDTLGHLLALHVTPANEHDREQVEKLAAAVQEEVTGESVELAYGDMAEVLLFLARLEPTKLRSSS